MRLKGEPLPLEVQQLLAPFFPGLDLSRVRIHEGIPRYVAIATAAEAIGYANGWHIYFAPGCYRTDSPECLALIAHEIAHCRQYHELGKWRFRAKYLAAYFQNRRDGMDAKTAYAQIPYEIEARQIERKVLAMLLRFQTSFSIE